jgi:ABC-2 type transport system permease protein
MTTLALLRTELTLLRRDTTAWATAIALPFVLGAWWIVNDPPFGEGAAAIVALQVTLLLVFTLHTVGTMALASRREQLVLKRWRSSQAGPVSVLVGTIGVPAGLVLLQAGVLTGMTMRAVGDPPASLPMLAAAVVAGIVTVGALTFLAAAFTRSAEHAMITTFPVILLLMGSTVWALLRPFRGDDWAVLALPGGVVTTLAQLAWNGPEGGGGVLAWLREAAPSLGATVVITVLATVAALRWFRWEPRG